MKKNEKEIDENIRIEFMQFIKYLGGILSDKVHEDTENSKFLYEDSTYLLQINIKSQCFIGAIYAWSYRNWFKTSFW